MTADTHSVWAETCQPSNLKQYIFQNSKHETIFKEFVETQSLNGHLFLSGPSGTGKTTLANVLVKELKVDPLDVLFVKASENNQVDFYRDTLPLFVNSMPNGDFRVVILDEADFISQNAQAVLRKTLENPNNPTRFILTCNYPGRMMPSLKSRCQQYSFAAPNQEDVTEYVARELIQKGIKIDLDILDRYVAAGYPDLRSIFNMVQPSCINGVLLDITNESTDGDYKFDLLPLLEKGNWKGCRKLLCESVAGEEWESVYTFLYQNIHRCTKFQNQDNWDQAIIAIADMLDKHTRSPDPEITAISLITQLSQI